ncbi:signal transduction histidine kinase [Amycolatopsis lexingtonensis]|uniref:histidine kinase n=1 Tax=Amycolatopsis lexingtonensis TaxID=218822 RepID=A0ABR9HTP6_9PSEU|nr:sensor histidine kinase [Amycolatopsis lexingtonensis]MBE1494297.1 signal transduction histidine kinase [Amycolatopsis lexingtonensis]
MRRALAWWDGRAVLLALDVAVAAAVIAVTLTGGDPRDPHPALYVPAVVVSGLALLVRRRWPFLVLLVAVGCMPAGVTLLPLMVAQYSVAVRYGVSVVTGLAVVIAGIAGNVVPALRAPASFTLLVIVLGFFVLGPALAGLWMHQRAALLAVLRERADEAERTRTLLADQAVFAERRRIAREMHDVVAHRVTAVALQAGALSLRAPDEKTEQAAETIRATSATALDELRGILRVLRDDAVAAPGVLGSLEDLVEEVTATGARVELALPDPLPAVPDQVGRAVYRVVQEALTNAGKHAPHAAVEVRLDVTGDRLAVEVTNRLTPHGSAVPGSGYGLVGMRERVELAGGELRTGPTGDGRFRVLARFPVGGETA